MELEEIGGLPAHPLLVHLPVVLVPLATVGVLLMLIKPSWRRSFGIPTAVLALVAAIATQLAMGSGEALEERVRESDLVETHSRIAEQARPFIFLFAIVVIAAVALDLYSRRAASGSASEEVVDSSAPRPVALHARAATAALVLTAVGLGLGVVSTAQVYRTGHSGAKATWHDTPDERPGEVGEGRGDGDGDGD